MGRRNNIYQEYGMSSVWYNPDTYTTYYVNGTKESDEQKILGQNDHVPLTFQALGSTEMFHVNYNTTTTADRMQYVNETSTGTTCPGFSYRLDSGANPIAWFHGPTRTATYRDSRTTTAGFTLQWHVSDDLEPGQAVVWDAGHTLRVSGNHDVESQKAFEKRQKKSFDLLKSWLSEAEYNYLMEQGNLELPSKHEKDTIYIINKDPMKRVAIKKKGKVVMKSLCIHASHQYADGDVLLSNIMLLKTDEKKFLEIANVHDMYA